MSSVTLELTNVVKLCPALHNIGYLGNISTFAIEITEVTKWFNLNYNVFFKPNQLVLMLKPTQTLQRWHVCRCYADPAMLWCVSFVIKHEPHDTDSIISLLLTLLLKITGKLKLYSASDPFQPFFQAWKYISDSQVQVCRPEWALHGNPFSKFSLKKHSLPQI